jgi:hypothetical protein
MASSSPQMRRSQRILATVPLTVTGESLTGFFVEETNTLVINAHGALLTLFERTPPGQLLRLKNNKTSEEEACHVVFLALAEQGGHKVGVEFARPDADFWHIAFPPQDWCAPTQ